MPRGSDEQSARVDSRKYCKNDKDRNNYFTIGKGPQYKRVISLQGVTAENIAWVIYMKIVTSSGRVGKGRQ